MSVTKKRILMGILSALFAPVASAHTGHVITGGFISGLLHPLTGLDHLLVMLVVGMLIGLRADTRYQGRWLLGFAGAFVIAMAAGSLGAGAAWLEFMLALSVLLAGVLLLKFASINSAVVMVFVLGMAGLHGYVHGLEMPASGQAAGWMSGVALAILMITAVAVQLGRAAASKVQYKIRLQVLGYGVVACGLAIAVT
jgi:urease accessory protein